MPRVKVLVRCRPPLSNESGRSSGKIETNEVDNTVRVQTSASNAKVFSFDGVLPETSSQGDCFDHVIPIIDHALDGLHATVFAYGQTGSGKTFTMEGIDYVGGGGGRPKPDPNTPREKHGIIPRTIEALFERARHRMSRDPNIQYRISVSYMQLYNERVSDLLNPTTSDNRLLKIRWNRNNKFTVDNLFHLECDNAEHTRELFLMGVKNKVMGSHAMNLQSSRSHCMFTFHITAYDPADRDATVRSELTLVDLAGSEKLGQLSSDPSRVLVKESIEINASLLALGKVITALASKAKAHVPYRDSKLTKLLQHALGGNSMTTMFACINPLDDFADESAATLMYAGRARNITNAPHVNEDPRTVLIRQLRAEILSLKEQLEQCQKMCAAGLSAPTTDAGSPPTRPGTDAEHRVGDSQLADKLIASCNMLKNLMDVNGKLRSAFDELTRQKDDCDRREIELQAENLSLRERIEVLESIVIDDGTVTTEPAVASSQEPRRAQSVEPRPKVPAAPSGASRGTPIKTTQVQPSNRETTPISTGARANLRDSVDASRKRTQQQQLKDYSRRFRNPQATGNYSEYYGLARKATEKAHGKQGQMVRDVAALVSKAGGETSTMVPLSLKAEGSFGSLAFGGTETEVSDLEERRRKRAERRAALEQKHQQLQSGFANIESLAGTVPPPQAAPVQEAVPRPASSGQRPRGAASSSEQLFDYLSVSESASVFTSDQLQRLRERRGVGGLPAAAPSRRDASHAQKHETHRSQEYRRELQSAQSLVTSLARSSQGR